MPQAVVRIVSMESGARARRRRVTHPSLGYKNTKYLTKIVFMPRMNGGYWSDQGYEWYGGT
jgi:DMSO/TMAO reductase YedYZ molybdopterin-dependent catalytic subunit